MNVAVPLHFLTHEQLQFFNDNGYLHLTSVVPEDLLCRTQIPMEKWVNRIITRWQKWELIDNDFSQYPFDRRLFEAWTAANYPPCNPMLTTEIFNKDIFDFLRAPIFHRVARDLMSTENVRALWGFTCRPKLPPRPPAVADGAPWMEVDVPWHQDAQYTVGGTPAFIIMWVPFVDVGEKRSPLQLAPGHHRDGRYVNHKQGGFCSIHPDELHNFSTLKTIEMKRGDMLCMHALLPHRSLMNQTKTIRWSFDLRFENMDIADHSHLADGFVCAHQDASKIEDDYEKCAENFHQQYKKIVL